jgi:predicted transcriptional regulator
MEDHIIETSIDELIRVLKKKEKMNLSEISDFLTLPQKQIEPILNILEENGIIEIKYPVIGEPKIVLKPNAPEKIEIKKSELVEEIKPDIKIESPTTSERLKAKTEIIQNNETKAINEKMEKLENNISDLSNKVDVSVFKEDLSEILLIIAGLKDVEKISFYLKEVLSIIHKMKEKEIWKDEDRDLVTTMLNSIADNWREYKEDDIAKLFDEVKGKVETA